MRNGVENFFIFGSVNTADYDVYCSGGGTYAAPARDVDIYHVLGRNGDLMIDHGSFKNIEVTYPCWISRGAPDKIDAFRQALCGLRGYQRITDPYHPNEYREGIFVDSFVPDMSNAGNDSARIDVVFNCKPQRFLTSGETRVSIYPGDILTNPTLFPAAPLLEAYGYGDIDIGDKTITIENTLLGEVTVFGSNGAHASTWIDLDGELFNTGDDLIATGAIVKSYFKGTPNTSNNVFYQVTLTDTGETGIASNWNISAGSTLTINVSLPDMAFVAGTAKTYTHVCTADVSYQNTVSGQTFIAAATITIAYQYRYSGGKHQIKMAASYSNLSYLTNNGYGLYPRRVIADSTLSANGEPTYIDLNIGEAWVEENGTVISVNGAVSIPPDLPVLDPGDNEISYDGNITQLEIIPRWWKI